MADIIHIILTFPCKMEDDITGFLALTHPQGWQTLAPSSAELCGFEVCFDNALEADIFVFQCREKFPLIEITSKTSEIKDWSEAWKEFYAPIPIGEKLIILPDWIEQFPEDKIPIFIKPQMAFGTGQHATTFLCLYIIEKLFAENKLSSEDFFLDIGTGSGILAIACSRFGISGAGIDIDPVAIDNARYNCELNDVDDMILLSTAMLDQTQGQFELVIANILLNPLLGMKDEICDRVKNNGHLILSGILESQVLDLQAAYTPLMGREPEIFRRHNWAALLF